MVASAANLLSIPGEQLVGWSAADRPDIQHYICWLPKLNVLLLLHWAAFTLQVGGGVIFSPRYYSETLNADFRGDSAWLAESQTGVFLSWQLSYCVSLANGSLAKNTQQWDKNTPAKITELMEHPENVVRRWHLSTAAQNSPYQTIRDHSLQ